MPFDPNKRGNSRFNSINETNQYNHYKPVETKKKSPILNIILCSIIVLLLATICAVVYIGITKTAKPGDKLDTSSTLPQNKVELIEKAPAEPTK